MTQANATLPADGSGPPVSAAELRFVRADHIAAGYSPWRHMALTLALALLLATGGLALAARARASDWMLLPVFLVIANLIEWMVHRNPMHRPLRPRIMYRNHAQLHHLAFTDGHMVIGPTRDLGLIMMPWYTMLGMFALASPILVVAGLLRAFRRLQAHHRHHHILGRMAAVNFNVTFPLWDRLFGTLEK